MIRIIGNSAKIIKAASACVWRGEEILLVQRGKALGYGRWSLPGGKLEAGESTKMAAARELHEETAVIADLQFHVGDFEIEANALRFVISCFTGFYVSGEAKAGDDAMAVAWVHHTALVEHDLAPNITEAVAIARNLIKL